MGLKNLIRRKVAKRIIAGFSSLVIAATTVAAAMPPITAAADSFVDVTYEWDTSINPYFRNAVTGTSKAVKVDGKAVEMRAGEQLCRFNVSDKKYYGLCVHPGASIKNNEKVHESETWDDHEENYIDSNGYWTNLQNNYPNQYRMIGRIGYYGYPNASTSNAAYVATQTLIWETTLGYRNCRNPKSFANELIEGKKPLYEELTFNSTNYVKKSDVVAAYNNILKNIASHEDLPEDFDHATETLAKKNPKLVKYDWSDMAYAASVTVENEYVDNDSWAFMNIEDQLKAFSTTKFKVTKKKGTKKTTIKLSSSTKNMKSGQTIVTNKITKSVDHGNLGGGKASQEMFSNAGVQTVIMGCNVDPISAYAAFELVNYPDSKVVKQYKDQNGNIITGSELAELLKNTKFIYQVTANNTTYYVVADKDSDGAYTFNHFTDSRSEATVFNLATKTDRGYFTVKDLPTTESGKKYRIKEVKVPNEHYKAKDTVVQLPSFNKLDVAQNTEVRTVITNDEISYMYEYGSLEFNKSLLDEDGGSSTLSADKLASSYNQMRFVLAYNDNGVVKYVKKTGVSRTSPVVIKNGTPMDITAESGLVNYASDDGKYYLISEMGKAYNKDGVQVTPFEKYDAFFTTDITEAFTFKLNTEVINGEAGDDFGKIFVNTVGLNSNGKTGKWMFIEMRSSSDYGISDNDTKNKFSMNELASAFDKVSSGYVSLNGKIEMTDTFNSTKWDAMGDHAFAVVEDYTESADSNDLTAYLDNEAYHYNLAVHKVRGGNGGIVSPTDTTGTPIKGVTVGLFNAKYEEIETLTTSGSGWDVFETNLKYDTTYYLKELSAPAGIKISDDYIEVRRAKITDMGNVTNSLMYYSLRSTKGNTIINYPFNLNLKIEKYNSLGNYNLANVGFKVITNQDIDKEYTVDITDPEYANKAYKAGDVVGYVTTDKNGEASYVGLPLMGDEIAENAEYYPYTYTLEEDVDTIPENFVKTAQKFEIQVPIDAAEDTDASLVYSMPVITVEKAIPNTPQTMDLTIQKNDEFGTPVEGAKFELYPTKDISVGGVVVQKANEKVAEFTTDKDGKANTTYTVTEYVKDANGDYVLDENGNKIVYRDYTETYTIYANQEYRLKEVYAPQPYVPSEDIVFSTDAPDKTVAITAQTVKVSEDVQRVKLNVNKVDEENNEVKLAGAEFTIYANENYYVGNKLVYNKGDEVVKITSDKNGMAATDKLYADCEYKLVETKAPIGYYDTHYTTTFKGEWDSNVTYVEKELSVENKRQKVNLTIYKTTDDGKRFLSGAKFKIYDSDTEIGEIETKSNGVAKSENILTLYAGKKYTVVESQPPAGFRATGYKADFISDFDDQIEYHEVELSVENYPTEVTIKKTDFSTGKLIPDCGIEILDENMTTVRQGRTDENGEVIFKELPVGKYYYREYDAPMGYVLDENPYAFEITEEGIVKAEMTNEWQTGVINIVKADSTSDGTYPLADAEFDIIATEETTIGNDTYAAGDVIESLVTDSDGKASSAKLYPVLKNYIVRETKAPEGYNLAPDQTVTMPYNVTVKNSAVTAVIGEDRQQGSIRVIKVDKDNNEVKLAGAKFNVVADSDIVVAGQLIYNAGDVIETIVTDENGEAVSTDLYTGFKYNVEELEAPEGYVLADAQNVDLAFDRTVKYVTKDVTFEDNRQKVILNVFKADAEDSTPLAGAEFTISAIEDNERWGIKNGDVIGKLITDDNGQATSENEFVLYAGIKYEMAETKAPDGYRDTHYTTTFSADFNAENVEYQTLSVNVLNTPTETTITKKDFSTGTVIPDCGIEILDENMNVVVQGRTDENGDVTFKRLPIGKYYYREYDAPAGYIIDETAYSFEITEEGIVKAEMTNKKTEVHISKKDFSTGELIPNCGIEILDEEMNVVVQGRTDENGEVVFEGLPIGKYYYREFDAPVGYQIDENAYPFEITKDGIVRAVMTDKQITGKLIILKTNEKGEALAGVEFEILDENGNVVATGKTDKDGKFECELTYGKYKYHEVKTLDGYKKDDKYYDFEITEQGQVVQAKVVNTSTGTGTPTPPNDTPSTTVDQNTPNNTTTSPQTGAAGNELGYISIALSAVMILVCARRRKKD